MSAIRGLLCNGGCGRSITWARDRGERFLLKSEMEQEARRRGWQAPDKLGRHLCPQCRRPDGRRKEARNA